MGSVRGDGADDQAGDGTQDGGNADGDEGLLEHDFLLVS